MVKILELPSSPNPSLVLLQSHMYPCRHCHYLHLLPLFCLPSHVLLWNFLCVLTFQSSFFHLRSLLALDLLLSSVSFPTPWIFWYVHLRVHELLLLSFRTALTAASFLCLSARCLVGSLRPSCCCLMDTDGDVGRLVSSSV